MQDTTPKTVFASRVLARMNEERLSLKELAEACHTTYEHVRKIVRGEALPSEHLTEKIALALNLPKLPLEKLAIEDRARLKGWTTVVAAAAGKNPALQPIERAWANLSDEHRKDVIAIVETFERLDRSLTTARLKTAR